MGLQIILDIDCMKIVVLKLDLSQRKTILVKDTELFHGGYFHLQGFLGFFFFA